jgi:hypothetical protein
LKPGAGAEADSSAFTQSVTTPRGPFRWLRCFCGPVLTYSSLIFQHSQGVFRCGNNLLALAEFVCAEEDFAVFRGMLDGKTIVADLARGPWADKRLSKRLEMIAGKLSANPVLSLPKAFTDSAELEGAYRFFGNPRVNSDDILSGHFEGTRQRCTEEQCVLVIHDTTKCSFREGGARRGLGRVVTSGQAFFAHVGLAIADDGMRRPLGVANVHTWVRTEEKTEHGSEHARWIRGVDVTAARLTGAKLIHVMDREGDDYALLSHLVQTNQLFVIRSLHDRLLENEPESRRKLNLVAAQIEQEVDREAKLSKRVDAKRSKKQKEIHPARNARKAKLSVGFATITLRKPKPHPRDSKEKQEQLQLLPPSLTLNIVRVWEAEPPEGEPPVEWVLITNTPIANIADALQAVERYRARWMIEEYFKALKTGCAYESRQLEDFESLVNVLAVLAPIACTLLDMRSKMRCAPDAPAETVVTKDELEVLRVISRIKLPPIPTVKDALLAIAALGGHIKYNGMPGWMTLWRGYMDLRLVTQGWRAAKLQPTCDQ